MKYDSLLLRGLEEHWKQFVLAWESTKRTADVKSVHNLRVAIRTIAASLTLLQSVVADKSIARLRRRFKKLQKCLGPIRDTQVQLLRVARPSAPAALKSLQQSLKKRENNEVQSTLRHLTVHRRRELKRILKNIEHNARRVLRSVSTAGVDKNVRSIIQMGFNELAAANAGTSISDPTSLHATRIAARKLRYLLESAIPILGPVPLAQLRMLRSYQSRLGDIRDLELLENEIRQGAKAATRPSDRAEIYRYSDALEQRRIKQFDVFSSLKVLPVVTQFVRTPLPGRRPLHQSLMPVTAERPVTR